MAQAKEEHPSKLGLKTKEQFLVEMASKDQESDLIKDTSALSTEVGLPLQKPKFWSVTYWSGKKIGYKNIFLPIYWVKNPRACICTDVLLLSDSVVTDQKKTQILAQHLSPRALPQLHNLLKAS